TCHLIHSAESRELEAVYLVEITSILSIDLFHSLLQRASDAPVVSSHLTDQHRSDDSVLIAHVRSCKVSVALLESKDEAVYLSCCLELCDLVADPLESCQDTSQLYSVVLCHCICQRCGHDGFHCHCLLRHGSFLNASRTDIIKKKDAHFIAAHQLIRAIRALHSDADTVCIRICREHQVSTCLLRQIQSLLQRLEDLRIRITAGREITVRILLIRNDRDICNADVLQHLCYRHKSGTVQRAVHELQPRRLAETRAYLS